MYPDRSVTYVPGLYHEWPNQRMHQPGRGPSGGAGWHAQPLSGRFPETRRALQVMRGR
jgi:hypothetical protein